MGEQGERLRDEDDEEEPRQDRGHCGTRGPERYPALAPDGTRGALEECDGTGNRSREDSGRPVSFSRSGSCPASHEESLPKVVGFDLRSARGRPAEKLTSREAAC